MTTLDIFAVGLALGVGASIIVVWLLALRDMRREVRRGESRFPE